MKCIVCDMSDHRLRYPKSLLSLNHTSVWMYDQIVNAMKNSIQCQFLNSVIFECKYLWVCLRSGIHPSVLHVVDGSTAIGTYSHHNTSRVSWYVENVLFTIEKQSRQQATLLFQKKKKKWKQKVIRTVKHLAESTQWNLQRSAFCVLTNNEQLTARQFD